jgi:uncharacterized protein
MSISSQLLESLACPQCHGVVTGSGDGQGVACKECQLLYPIRSGIPVMAVSEAVPSSGEERVPSSSESQGGSLFKIIEGNSQGMEVPLAMGCCRAIGRSVEDLESTRVIDAGAVVALDDTTKQLVMNFITQKFDSGISADESTNEESDIHRLGNFRRLPDMTLSDRGVSRLHAMIFHGPTGVGILDLVSKNGTFVNDEEVESRFLRVDDIIAIGDTKIKVAQNSS